MIRVKMPIIVLITALFPLSGFAGDLDKRAAESRQIVSRFAADLKGYLKSALKEGGPRRAVSVCNEIAPQIAAGFEDQTGWQIGRTSLKYRNPDNAPDSWEKKVLQNFQEQNQTGQNPGQMEFYTVVEKEGREYFRYMKAIPVQGVCLNCHGQYLTPVVKKTIDNLYPQDRARGYSVGDIRGAFTIVQPVSEP